MLNISTCFIHKTYMKIIKLNAIDSTNSFLKDMASKVALDNLTVVVAKKQTAGRGQRNTRWNSQAGKALTFSVYTKFDDFLVADYKYLNYAVSLAVYQAINMLNLSRLTIKWPNDILSENKKIAGILIENSLTTDKINTAIIGIGVNVNQNKFPKDLPNASSIKKMLAKKQAINSDVDNNIDLDFLLDKILVSLAKKLEILHQKEYQLLENDYLSVLYKKNVPSMFKTTQNTLFMGKIIGVSKIGNLQIELENETIQEFGIKEVSFA